MVILAPRIEQRNGRAGPTGPARIAGAAGMMLTAWGALSMALQYLPFATRGPFLLPITLAAAAWSGGRICGACDGRGAVAAAARGARGAFGCGVWVLAFAGVEAMIARAGSGFYADPFEAVLDVPAQAIALAGRLAHPDIAATLFLGGVVSAMVAEWVGRRWR